MRTIIRLLFYPTLYYNRLLCALGIWRAWDWIDEHVAVGSLPTRRRLAALAKQEVGGVVNLCQEFDGYEKCMRDLSMEQLHLKTLDYHPPTEPDMLAALTFIARQIAHGKKVYIHCKAGRGRSATTALCYLIAQYGCTPDEAYRRLRQARPHIDRNIQHRDAVQAIARRVQNGERLLTFDSTSSGA